jgi:GNAT superfamily N-acetyltransferase
MIHIALATSDEELLRCYPVMKQLRPNITQQQFLDQVARQNKQGYQVCSLEEKGVVRCVAGFRITERLAYGKFLYVDDLITHESHRCQGYGNTLFDWLVDYARENDCKALGLESGVQRFAAHRFYMRKKMWISAYHFSLPLSDLDQSE